MPAESLFVVILVVVICLNNLLPQKKKITLVHLSYPTSLVATKLRLTRLEWKEELPNPKSLLTVDVYTSLSSNVLIPDFFSF